MEVTKKLISHLHFLVITFLLIGDKIGAQLLTTHPRLLLLPLLDLGEVARE